MLILTCEEFAAYCRRIRECNNPAALARIRAELDRLYPHSADSQDARADGYAQASEAPREQLVTPLPPKHLLVVVVIGLRGTVAHNLTRWSRFPLNCRNSSHTRSDF